MAQAKYNPELWLETTVRAIKDYVSNFINTNIYQVVMEFPGPLLDNKTVPLNKTILHFEVDEIAEMPLGFGDNIGNLNYDVGSGTVNPQEAREIRINFDVGVWASDASGGTTARMRAHQLLTTLFGGKIAQDSLRVASDGGDGYIEILRFSGGRFAIDSVNDQRLYRTVDCTLEVRVFSRTRISDTPGPAIEEIDQDPGLTVMG